MASSNSKPKSILFMGRLTIDNTPCAGEVMKNRLFCERLEAAGGKVKRFNVTKYRSRLTYPFLVAKIVLTTLFHNYTRIIVSTHDTLALRIINILGILGKSKSTIYWVIGGGVSKKIEKGELKSKYYQKLDKIIVEDIDIEKHLNEMGFSRVLTVPNFKPVVEIDKDKVTSGNKFIFVSRITPLKGCDMILSAVKELNRKNLPFEVDFYGFIEKGYPFEEYVKDIPNVNYKGVLSLKSQKDYEFLGSYAALLFPTFYPNEGFPGTMIDGFIAGLPIISTDWRYNSHIMENNKHGWLLPIQDAGQLASVMEGVINNTYDLQLMGRNCLERAKEFDTSVVLSKDFLAQINLV